MKQLLFRVLHWGPITALMIIKCVTLTTLTLTSMWLPPTYNTIALMNNIFYMMMIGVTAYNLFCAMFIGPGFVPLQWKPEKEDHVKFLQFCSCCNGYKAPRSHHCRKCNRCVLKMDHHCPWINTCCGYKNHCNFTYFLFASVLGSIHSLILLVMGLYRAYYFV